jgi:glyoxylase-like metal-dependent hydrolase (beta-lactamase superfamily II)
LADRLILTKQQFEGLARASKEPIPPAYASMAHLDLTAPTRIAQGVVMIPAPGHTIGSAMFYVRHADGREVLFLGDIAWAISNVRTATMRPRFVEQFFLSGENRAQVADQIRALFNLSQAEPALIMIPAHDDAYLGELMASGLLKPHFVIDGP